jgi:ribose 5-phosphate isomerase B
LRRPDKGTAAEYEDKERELRIALGCDHNGVELKLQLINMLNELGHELKDFGCYDTNSVDYPDVAQEVAIAVGESRFEQGILICGSGIGMSIAANKVPGIRAALCQDPVSASRAREHNDANVLCLPGLYIERDAAQETVRAYLEGEFEGGRHARRVDKISSLEKASMLETSRAPRSG